MSTLFYSTLKLDEHAPVFIWGEKCAHALLCLLAAEAKHNHRLALVLSDDQQVYPIEGKVLVSPETDLLNDLLKTEPPEVMYLARAVKNDILQPYGAAEIKKILAQSKQPMLPFLYVKKDKQNLKQLIQAAARPLCLCVINYQKAEQVLLDTAKRAGASEKTVNRKILDIIATHCERFNEMDCMENSVLFIDQVKTILEENKLLSVLRKFNEQFRGRIFMGNISQYRIKEI